MKLDRVTITGADDSVRPADLVRISEEFPFVEWAILFGPNNHGLPRWPSLEWLSEMAAPLPLRLSAHICGGYMRDFLLGGTRFIDLFPSFLQRCARMQLNFHAEKQGVRFQELIENLEAISRHPQPRFPEGCQPLQFIFQIDGVNDYIFDNVFQGSPRVDSTPLFDGSHGAGALPDRGWPKADYVRLIPSNDADSIEIPIYHGYAGGLGPDTLESQLPLIANAAGDARIWIDMETRIRSSDDKLFDLNKVRRCLEICRPWVIDNRLPLHV